MTGYYWRLLAPLLALAAACGQPEAAAAPAERAPVAAEMPAEPATAQAVTEREATSHVGTTRPTCIVLDPGHGGDEWGASNGGVRESHLTLDLAQRAATRLRAGLPGVRVALTREEDREVSLAARVRVAEAREAALFVSIHLNDSTAPLREGGVTTFVHEGARRADTRRLADRVHRALLAAGRATLPALSDRGVREQPFVVLEETSMPAILVEASFMNDPEELRALRSSAYRDALAAGIADGILQYLYGE
jgi:N-acetylmuramoyl-L-alanine amidase